MLFCTLFCKSASAVISLATIVWLMLDILSQGIQGLS